jgi:hypothetical protein
MEPGGSALAPDEDRLGAEPALGLVSRNDCTKRGRGDDVDRSERFARFSGGAKLVKSLICG